MKKIIIAAIALVLSAVGSLSGQSRLVRNLSEGKPQTLVVYGTSIESNKNGQMWVAELGAEINRRYSDKLTIYNSGCSGKNSEWALENLRDSVLAKSPNTVIIEFATNDAVTRFDISIEKCRANTERIIDEIYASDPNCEVIMIAACGYPLGKGAENRPHLDDYNETYRSIARRRGLQLIDIAAYLKRIGVEYGADSLKYWVRDGIHSSERGAMELFYPTTLRALTGEPDLNRILTPKASDTPRINSARRFGVRSGAPFLYRIAASGAKPMRFSAEGLPHGLKLDSESGQITGRLSKHGEYFVSLVAENNAGRDKRELCIVVGEDIALTPPMGWNSWNCWGAQVSAENVLSSALAMVKRGLIDYGWTYINIDDGWQGIRGGRYGAIQPNRKFPDMKELSDRIHALGLKLGIYSSPWVATYAGFIGSSADNIEGRYEWIENGNHDEDYRILNAKNIEVRRAIHYLGSHSFVAADVKQWTEWGIDYLKYDWSPNDVESAKQMSEELLKSKRDIVFSISNRAPYNHASVWSETAECWRTTGDIKDTWESVSRIGFGQDRWIGFTRPGHWADADMLVVGTVGWGDGLHATRLTDDEQYSHISLWAMLSTPLLIGCDITQLDDFTLGLLCNVEVNDINQDPLGRQAAPLLNDTESAIYVKHLFDGSMAVALFNKSDSYRTMNFTVKDLGFNDTCMLRDVWRNEDLSTIEPDHLNEFYIAPHGVRLLKIKLLCD